MLASPTHPNFGDRDALLGSEFGKTLAQRAVVHAGKLSTVTSHIRVSNACFATNTFLHLPRPLARCPPSTKLLQRPLISLPSFDTILSQRTVQPAAIVKAGISFTRTPTSTPSSPARLLPCKATVWRTSCALRLVHSRPWTAALLQIPLLQQTHRIPHDRTPATGRDEVEVEAEAGAMHRSASARPQSHRKPN